jgi:hypothetical protein
MGGGDKGESFPIPYAGNESKDSNGGSYPGLL